MQPTVAVVIPAYHAAPFIKKCLDSICEQTYKDYRVLIVLDDPFFDNTMDIVTQHPLYNEAHKVEFLYSYEKSNPASARNRGVRYVYTHWNPYYIAFCDADDWWHPTKLGRQMGKLYNEFDKDLCYTLSEWHYSDGRIEYHGVPWGEKPLWLVCVAPHSSIVIRSDVAKFHPFNENLNAADDYRWLLDLYNDDVTFCSIDEPLSYMGVHENNLTTGTGRRFVAQTCKVHLEGGEYHLVILKFVLGTGLLVKRYIWKKLGLKSRGMTA